MFFLSSKADRVDAEQRQIIGGSDVTLQLGNNTWTPGACRLQGSEALV